MDSMTEMFYDESSGILCDMRKCLMTKPEEGYGQDVVEELFRGVHTLKAESAMMLYEQMAALSSTLESLMYCFRGEGKRIEDTKRFSDIISEYLNFFETETDKLPQGKAPDGDAHELEMKIKDYTTEMTDQMQDDEKAEYHQKISKPRRQVFYIAGATDDKKDSSAPKETAKEEKEPKEEQPPVSQKETPSSDNFKKKRKKKKYIISTDARDKICQASRDLLRLADALEYSHAGDGQIVVSENQLKKLRRIQGDLEEAKQELVNTDFVPVARKMEIVVDEMSDELGKPVKLLIKGEETLVESEKREKISGALIHLIRNAVDHGIEDMETRERLGKSPMGLIKLRFGTEDGNLEISVKDDGAGIDTKAVLKAAQKNGGLEKPAEEYTEKEIYKLMLRSGVTTTEKANAYSGRGVGMDVINHNVEELGGKLKISSKKGIGTTFTMKF